MSGQCRKRVPPSCLFEIEYSGNRWYVIKQNVTAYEIHMEYLLVWESRAVTQQCNQMVCYATFRPSLRDKARLTPFWMK